MKFLQALIAKLFKDPVDGTISQTKVTAFVAAALYFIEKKWGLVLPDWLSSIFSVEDIKAMIVSALMIFFGVGVKDAIAKSSVQSEGDTGMPLTPPTANG